MIYFESVIADPFRLGRKNKFDIIHRNLFIGNSPTEAEISYMIDTSDGVMRIIRLSPRGRGALSFIPQSNEEFICEFNETKERDRKLMDKVCDVYENETPIQLEPSIKEILINVLLGKAQTELISGDLRALLPGVEIIHDENARFAHEFFIDEELMNLEDFVLEMNRAIKLVKTSLKAYESAKRN